MNSWALDGTVVQTGGTTYTLTNITANHTVNVTFKLQTYTITPSAGVNGTISPSTAQTVNYGSSLTFTATPSTGYNVNTWSVDGTVAQTGGTTYALTNITASHTVKVTFIPMTFNVMPAAGANGTISPSTLQTVNYGNSLTFTATPNPGYMVSTWSVDGTVAQTGGLTYLLADITASHYVQVAFTTSTYTVTPGADANGTISPSTAQTVSSGGSLTFTATPNTGYSVNTWSLDGTVVQTGGTTYTLSNITANHTVYVTFTALTYTVTPGAGANGTISPSTAQTVSSGGSLTFTATPNTNYMVNTWSLDGTVVQNGGTTYTLANITANHTVNVTFTLSDLYRHSLPPGVYGTISPNTAQTVSIWRRPELHRDSDLRLYGQYLVAGWHGGADRRHHVLPSRNITANHTVNVIFTPSTFLSPPAPA